MNIFSFSINEASGSLDHNRPLDSGPGMAAVVSAHSLFAKGYLWEDSFSYITRRSGTVVKSTGMRGENATKKAPTDQSRPMGATTHGKQAFWQVRHNIV